MINLSLNDLWLIAQIRNISNYQNKSKKDLIKAPSEPKPTPTPKPKPETKINKKKLEEIRKDFYELRHKFSKEERDRLEKLFMIFKTTNIFPYQK